MLFSYRPFPGSKGEAAKNRPKPSTGRAKDEKDILANKVANQHLDTKYHPYTTLGPSGAPGRSPGCFPHGTQVE
jgi:hypothetical protein